MLSFCYYSVAYISGCLYLRPLVKLLCALCGSGVALMRGKGAGSPWETLPEARSAPGFGFQVNRPMPGQGCRSKAWSLAVLVLTVVDGKSSSTLKFVF